MGPPPKKKRGCLLFALGAFVLLLGGCTAIVVIASLGTSTENETGTVNNIADVTDDDSSDEAEQVDDESEVLVAGGTRDDPYTYDQLTTIEFDVFGDADGSRWNLLVTPISDVTDAVIGENQFNEPPPDGVVFAGFTAELTLVEASKEPLSVGFNFSFEIIGGSTAAVYDQSTIETESFGCGVTPDDFDEFAEAYVGGTIDGLVCIPIPTEDLDDEGTQVALNFGGDRLYFGPDGSSPDPLPTPAPADPFPTGERVGTREEPFGFDDPSTVVFETFGDADDSEWLVQIGAISDIAEVVLASNQFNEPPPEGVAYAGFQADMTLLSANKEPLSPGFNFSWEIIGGASAKAYGVATLDTNFIGCGVTDGDFDDFSEIFVNGTLSGLVCIPVPIEDLTHPNTRVAMNFTDGDRIHFGP